MIAEQVAQSPRIATVMATSMTAASGFTRMADERSSMGPAAKRPKLPESVATKDMDGGMDAIELSRLVRQIY